MAQPQPKRHVTTEYKVGIAGFYPYVGFGADLLKMWSPEPENY